MSFYEILTIVISALSFLISTTVGISTWKVYYSQKKINQGQIELQIHQLLSQTKKNLLDLSLKFKPDDKEIIYQALKSAIELNINGYEEACAKYLDEKVDKKRFKKNYYIEIQQLVEDKNNEDRFNATTSKYKCILKVYEEWFNLEN